RRIRGSPQRPGKKFPGLFLLAHNFGLTGVSYCGAKRNRVQLETSECPIVQEHLWCARGKQRRFWWPRSPKTRWFRASWICMRQRTADRDERISLPTTTSSLKRYGAKRY